MSQTTNSTGLKSSIRLSEFIDRISQKFSISREELWELYNKPYPGSEKCCFINTYGQGCDLDKDAGSLRCYKHRILDDDWPSCVCHNGRSKIHYSQKAQDLKLCLTGLRSYEQEEFEKKIPTE